ncbi:TetR/AcrR family transcriptional regulator [Rugosimonospora africana]|uniref:TetR family transcriptional regulator n=1 Tax=Rugosimonospora africana TaxID=556532 RepID=A0A8J3VRY7_9ACTN|nr:TetR/AcrR family transcriptional regulator [Rugosimonospora africana]GIH15883.1 TetR family transcriptional regulator [Rugosimonospora africana]
MTIQDRRGTEPDRRVRRTRRILREALVSLILDKGYDRVTVQDILDRADVGRSTFYAHYRDKEALLVSCFDDLRDDLRREFDAMTPDADVDPAGPAAILFGHAHRHRDLYRALCGRRGGSLVERHLHQLVSDLLHGHLRPHLAAAGSDLAVDVVVEFYASAALGLLVWWVNQDFRHHPDRLARMYQRLAASGLSTEPQPAG